MSIELNRTTFKRLVQLYLLGLAVAVVASTYETVAWSGFGDAFDELVRQHFGETADWEMYLALVIGLLSLAAHIGAAIGLMGFRRWARPTFWGSMLLLFCMMLIPGLGPSWSGFWSMITETATSALFGAILLLSYARDYGAEWFHIPTLEEIF